MQISGEEISAAIVDMYCIKPLDKEAIVRAATGAGIVITVEEHAPFGGLDSMVSQVVGRECSRKVIKRTDKSHEQISALGKAEEIRQKTDNMAIESVERLCYDAVIMYNILF